MRWKSWLKVSQKVQWTPNFSPCIHLRNLLKDAVSALAVWSGPIFYSTMRHSKRGETDRDCSNTKWTVYCYGKQLHISGNCIKQEQRVFLNRGITPGAPCMFFMLGKETGIPGENLPKHREDMQTPHSLHRPTQESNPAPSCREASLLTTVPPYLCFYANVRSNAFW